jgi:AraC family transcriptional regulator of arabinose operon
VQNGAVSIAEGFPHERMVVLPRPLVASALARPVTRRLLVTDVGVFPHAAHHGRERPSGAQETILVVCAAGAGWVRVGGVRHGIGAASALILPSDTPHQYGSSDHAPWTIWWCHLRGSDVPELTAATGATIERPVLQLRNPDRAVALIDEIIGGLSRDLSPARMGAASGGAWKLLTQITLDTLLPEQGDPLERAMRYVAERLDSAIRVPELASMVGVSSSHLSALFRAATGGGVLAHQTALRMSRARTLLDGSNLHVAEVAREVGYTDPLYFSRQFRRTHGLSPTEYRAQHKG